MLKSNRQIKAVVGDINRDVVRQWRQVRADLDFGCTEAASPIGKEFTG